MANKSEIRRIRINPATRGGSLPWGRREHTARVVAAHCRGRRRRSGVKQGRRTLGAEAAHGALQGCGRRQFGRWRYSNRRNKGAAAAHLLGGGGAPEWGQRRRTAQIRAEEGRPVTRRRRGGGEMGRRVPGRGAGGGKSFRLSDTRVWRRLQGNRPARYFGASVVSGGRGNRKLIRPFGWDYGLFSSKIGL